MSSAEVATFLRQLAVMLRNQVPVPEAMDIAERNQQLVIACRQDESDQVEDPGPQLRFVAGPENIGHHHDRRDHPLCDPQRWRGVAAHGRTVLRRIGTEHRRRARPKQAPGRGCSQVLIARRAVVRRRESPAGRSRNILIYRAGARTKRLARSR